MGRRTLVVWVVWSSLVVTHVAELRVILALMQVGLSWGRGVLRGGLLLLLLLLSLLGLFGRRSWVATGTVRIVCLTGQPQSCL